MLSSCKLLYLGRLQVEFYENHYFVKAKKIYFKITSTLRIFFFQKITQIYEFMYVNSLQNTLGIIINNFVKSHNDVIFSNFNQQYRSN